MHSKDVLGCIDGLLCQIKVPSSNETGHVKSYFSGHYFCYGVNVQATCDASCRFTSVSVLCPGGANDVRAYSASPLEEIIEGLPPGFYVLGDNAYICTDRMLTFYSGRNKFEMSKDAYNFHLSQLRIRIEQTFGLLVNKWRIFKAPLEVALEKVPMVIHAAMRLHNFCIDNRDWEIPARQKPADIATYVEDYMSYDHSSIHGHGTPLTETQRFGSSRLREFIRNDLQRQGIQRPMYNICRNNTN